MTKLDATNTHNVGKATPQSGAVSSTKPASARVEGIICRKCFCSNDAGSKFCEECGMSLSASACKNCDAELEDNAIFCGECGHRRVEAAETAPVSVSDVKETSAAEPVNAKSMELSAFNSSVPKKQPRPAKKMEKQSFVSAEVMSKSEVLIKALQSVKQNIAEQQPLNERLKNLKIISKNDMLYSLQYELLGPTPAFVTCNIAVNGITLPPRRLTFSGDVWKDVRPGKHYFSWDLKRDCYLIPDSCLNRESLDIWVSLDIEAN